MSRRQLLLFASSLFLLIACASAKTEKPNDKSTREAFEALEKESNGRLGIFVINTADNSMLGYRSTERFGFCSTFKALLASAVLAGSIKEEGLLDKRILYTQADLVTYSPITEKQVAEGMTVSELCAASIQYSDNTASNLLLKLLGGPSELTAFAQSIGDQEFRLDRIETELNSCTPDDPRDTSTPEAMAKSLQKTALGEVLTQVQREQLQSWLIGNTTGNERIRAGLPKDWKVGDKTGSGNYGTTNDIAIVWPPNKAPIIIAVYFTQKEQDAKWKSEVIAEATRIAVNRLSFQN